MSTPSGRPHNRHRGPIPKNHSIRIPTRFVVFDAEASGISSGDVSCQTLRLGVCSYVEVSDGFEITRRDTFRFKSVSEFASFLESKVSRDRMLWVFAHNISYDLELSGILNELERRGWKLTTLIVSDPPVVVRLTKARRSIQMVDTFNYWQTSVAALGEMLGRQKLEMPNEGEDDYVWFRYCVRDVEILVDAIVQYMRFLSANDLGSMQVTLASQAFAAFRHRFMAVSPVVHCDDRVLELERAGYYGGRVEAFRLGDLSGDTYVKLDVNSMYPYVMREYEYPIELIAYSESIPVERLFNLMGRFYVIADVTIETSVNAFPYRYNGKLLFPVGRFRTVLHQSELMLAKDRARILAVHRVAIYRSARIFSDYVNFFYTLKADAESRGDRVTRQFAKIMLNSLYGKFGQTGHHNMKVEDAGLFEGRRVISYSESLGRRVEMVRFGGEMMLMWSEGESYYSCPSIAGAVTAYARVTLFNYMERVGLEHVCYVDTDSLIIPESVLHKLSDVINTAKIGHLKLEGRSERLVIHGLKDYIFGGDTKIKGVPRRAKNIAEGVWQYEQFERMKSWLNRGGKPGVLVKLVTKYRRATYDKGVVMPNGFVVPLTLNESPGFGPQLGAV